jgi:hypothetical protein
MSLSDRDKIDLAEIVEFVMAKKMAEICDIIETDMRACIVDLLLKLGPILQEQNGRAITQLFKQGKDEDSAEAKRRREKFIQWLKT